MDKDDLYGIYKYCKGEYENIKVCCTHPEQCQESWGRKDAEDLRKDSLSYMEAEGEGLSCQIQNLSRILNFLSENQAEYCDLSVGNCKVACENKLLEVIEAFRSAFFVPDDYSIDEVLKKASNPPKGQELCYKEMQAIAKAYKEQSLNKKALLREGLKASDIIRCEDMKQARSRESLNSFALETCQRAQVNIEEKAIERKAHQQARQAQGQARQMQEQIQEQAGLNFADSSAPGNPALNTPRARNSSSSDLLKGAGVIAGATAIGLGVQALGGSKDKDSDQKKSEAKSAKSSVKSPQKNSTQAKAPSLKEKSEEKSTAQTQSQKKSKNRIAKAGKISKQMNTTSSSRRASLTGSLSGNKLNRPLRLAMANKPEGFCSVKTPKIRFTTVFQSVEAPQIEPLKEQDNPYDNYDLVMGKPAGVLVYLDTTNMNTREFFNLDIRIGDFISYKGVKCFHTPSPKLESMVEERGVEIPNCSFTKNNLSKEGIMKFFLSQWTGIFCKKKELILSQFLFIRSGMIPQIVHKKTLS